jgi:hypothetical protein
MRGEKLTKKDDDENQKYTFLSTLLHIVLKAASVSSTQKRQLTNNRELYSSKSRKRKKP